MIPQYRFTASYSTGSTVSAGESSRRIIRSISRLSNLIHHFTECIRNNEKGVEFMYNLNSIDIASNDSPVHYCPSHLYLGMLLRHIEEVLSMMEETFQEIAPVINYFNNLAILAFFTVLNLTPYTVGIRYTERLGEIPIFLSHCSDIYGLYSNSDDTNLSINKLLPLYETKYLDISCIFHSLHYICTYYKAEVCYLYYYKFCIGTKGTVLETYAKSKAALERIYDNMTDDIHKELISSIYSEPILAFFLYIPSIIISFEHSTNESNLYKDQGLINEYREIYIQLHSMIVSCQYSIHCFISFNHILNLSTSSIAQLRDIPTVHYATRNKALLLELLTFPFPFNYSNYMSSTTLNSIETVKFTVLNAEFNICYLKSIANAVYSIATSRITFPYLYFKSCFSLHIQNISIAYLTFLLDQPQCSEGYPGVHTSIVSVNRSSSYQVPHFHTVSLLVQLAAIEECNLEIAALLLSLFHELFNMNVETQSNSLVEKQQSESYLRYTYYTFKHNIYLLNKCSHTNHNDVDACLCLGECNIPWFHCQFYNQSYTSNLHIHPDVWLLVLTILTSLTKVNDLSKHPHVHLLLEWFLFVSSQLDLNAYLTTDSTSMFECLLSIRLQLSPQSLSVLLNYSVSISSGYSGVEAHCTYTNLLNDYLSYYMKQVISIFSYVLGSNSELSGLIRQCLVYTCDYLSICCIYTCDSVPHRVMYDYFDYSRIYSPSLMVNNHFNQLLNNSYRSLISFLINTRDDYLATHLELLLYASYNHQGSMDQSPVEIQIEQCIQKYKLYVLDFILLFVEHQHIVPEYNLFSFDPLQEHLLTIMCRYNTRENTIEAGMDRYALSIVVVNYVLMIIQCLDYNTHQSISYKIIVHLFSLFRELRDQHKLINEEMHYACDTSILYNLINQVAYREFCILIYLCILFQIVQKNSQILGYLHCKSIKNHKPLLTIHQSLLYVFKYCILKHNLMKQFQKFVSVTKSQAILVVLQAYISHFSDSYLSMQGFNDTVMGTLLANFYINKYDLNHLSELKDLCASNSLLSIQADTDVYIWDMINTGVNYSMRHSIPDVLDSVYCRMKAKSPHFNTVNLWTELLHQCISFLISIKDYHSHTISKAGVFQEGGTPVHISCLYPLFLPNESEFTLDLCLAQYLTFIRNLILSPNCMFKSMLYTRIVVSSIVTNFQCLQLLSDIVLFCVEQGREVGTHNSRYLLTSGTKDSVYATTINVHSITCVYHLIVIINVLHFILTRMQGFVALNGASLRLRQTTLYGMLLMSSTLHNPLFNQLKDLFLMIKYLAASSLQGVSSSLDQLTTEVDIINRIFILHYKSSQSHLNAKDCDISALLYIVYFNITQLFIDIAPHSINPTDSLLSMMSFSLLPYLSQVTMPNVTVPNEMARSNSLLHTNPTHCIDYTPMSSNIIYESLLVQTVETLTSRLTREVLAFAPRCYIQCTGLICTGALLSTKATFLENPPCFSYVQFLQIQLLPVPLTLLEQDSIVYYIDTDCYLYAQIHLCDGSSLKHRFNNIGVIPRDTWVMIVISNSFGDCLVSTVNIYYLLHTTELSSYYLGSANYTVKNEVMSGYFFLNNSNFNWYIVKFVNQNLPQSRSNVLVYIGAAYIYSCVLSPFAQIILFSQISTSAFEVERNNAMLHIKQLHYKKYINIITFLLRLTPHETVPMHSVLSAYTSELATLSLFLLTNTIPVTKHDTYFLLELSTLTHKLEIDPNAVLWYDLTGSNLESSEILFYYSPSTSSSTYKSYSLNYSVIDVYPMVSITTTSLLEFLNAIGGFPYFLVLLSLVYYHTTQHTLSSYYRFLSHLLYFQFETSNLFEYYFVAYFIRHRVYTDEFKHSLYLYLLSVTINYAHPKLPFESFLNHQYEQVVTVMTSNTEEAPLISTPVLFNLLLYFKVWIFDNFRLHLQCLSCLLKLISCLLTHTASINYIMNYFTLSHCNAVEKLLTHILSIVSNNELVEYLNEELLALCCTVFLSFVNINLPPEYLELFHHNMRCLLNGLKKLSLWLFNAGTLIPNTQALFYYLVLPLLDSLQGVFSHISTINTSWSKDIMSDIVDALTSLLIIRDMSSRHKVLKILIEIFPSTIEYKNHLFYLPECPVSCYIFYSYQVLYYNSIDIKEDIELIKSKINSESLLVVHTGLLLLTLTLPGLKTLYQNVNDLNDLFAWVGQNYSLYMYYSETTLFFLTALMDQLKSSTTHLDMICMSCYSIFVFISEYFLRIIQLCLNNLINDKYTNHLLELCSNTTGLRLLETVFEQNRLVITSILTTMSQYLSLSVEKVSMFYYILIHINSCNYSNLHFGQATSIINKLVSHFKVFTNSLRDAVSNELFKSLYAMINTKSMNLDLFKKLQNAMLLVYIEKKVSRDIKNGTSSSLLASSTSIISFLKSIEAPALLIQLTRANALLPLHYLVKSCDTMPLSCKNITVEQLLKDFDSILKEFLYFMKFMTIYEHHNAALYIILYLFLYIWNSNGISGTSALHLDKLDLSNSLFFIYFKLISSRYTPLFCLILHWCMQVLIQCVPELARIFSSNLSNDQLVRHMNPNELLRLYLSSVAYTLLFICIANRHNSSELDAKLRLYMQDETRSFLLNIFRQHKPSTVRIFDYNSLIQSITEIDASSFISKIFIWKTKLSSNLIDQLYSKLEADNKAVISELTNKLSYLSFFNEYYQYSPSKLFTPNRLLSTDMRMLYDAMCLPNNSKEINAYASFITFKFNSIPLWGPSVSFIEVNTATTFQLVLMNRWQVTSIISFDAAKALMHQTVSPLLFTSGLAFTHPLHTSPYKYAPHIHIHLKDCENLLIEDRLSDAELLTIYNCNRNTHSLAHSTLIERIHTSWNTYTGCCDIRGGIPNRPLFCTWICLSRRPVHVYFYEHFFACYPCRDDIHIELSSVCDIDTMYPYPLVVVYYTDVLAIWTRRDMLREVGAGVYDHFGPVCFALLPHQRSERNSCFTKCLVCAVLTPCYASISMKHYDCGTVRGWVAMCLH